MKVSREALLREVRGLIEDGHENVHLQASKNVLRITGLDGEEVSERFITCSGDLNIKVAIEDLKSMLEFGSDKIKETKKQFNELIRTLDIATLYSDGDLWHIGTPSASARIKQITKSN